MKPNIWIVPALLACGCSTTLKGQAAKSGEVSGVPFRLPEANFVVSEAPATTDKPVTYSLSMVPVPSSSRVYWVNLGGSGPASREITVSLGAQGQLGSLNASATSSIPAIVQSVGDFVVGGIAVAAKIVGVAALADTSLEKPPGLIGELKRFANKEHVGEACAHNRDVAAADEKSQEARIKECGSAMPDAVHRLVGRLNIDLDDAANVMRLYPETENERAVLEAASGTVKVYKPATFATARLEYLASANNLPKVVAPDDAKKDADALDAAISALDASGIAAVVRPKAAKQDPGEKLKRLKKLALVAINERRLAKTFAEAAKLSSREWRNRRATVLEDRIDEIDRALALQPAPSSALQTERQRVQREWADSIDGATEFARAQVLRSLLVQSPATTVATLGKGSQQPRLTEYALARAELDALNTALSQKRAALKSPPAADPKPQPRDIRIAPVWFETAGASTASWVAETAAGSGFPEFMVVVEKGSQQ